MQEQGRCAQCILASGSPWCKEVGSCKSKVCKGSCAYHRETEEVEMKTPEIPCIPESRPVTPTPTRTRPSVTPITPVPVTPHMRALEITTHAGPSGPRTEWGGSPTPTPKPSVRLGFHEIRGFTPVGDPPVDPIVNAGLDPSRQAQLQACIDVYDEGQRRLEERRAAHKAAQEQQNTASGTQPAAVHNTPAPEAEIADEEVP